MRERRFLVNLFLILGEIRNMSLLVLGGVYNLEQVLKIGDCEKNLSITSIMKNLPKIMGKV